MSESLSAFRHWLLGQTVCWLFGCDHYIVAMRTPPSTAQEPNVCSYCGFVAWTIRKYGRLTHKHSCPNRTQPFCQTHPLGCYEAKL